MSKIALTPNASGTGTLTIAAPNTNTDSTINLPDSAGSFVTADTSGNVGIGTSSTSYKLDVQGTPGSNPIALFKNTAASGEATLRLQTAANDKAVVEYYTNGNGNWRAGPGITTAGAFEINSVTAGATRMLIDSSGRVTMPYQPSFAAYRGSYSLPTQSWTTIVYDNCTLNRGSHYSTSTGRFTAPVAGYYYFEAIGEGGGGQFHTLIAVNGATPSGYADTAQNWTSSNVSRQALVVSLSANDYVFVQHYIDSGKTMTNNRSHFHGWLIG